MSDARAARSRDDMYGSRLGTNDPLISQRAIADVVRDQLEGLHQNGGAFEVSSPRIESTNGFHIPSIPIKVGRPKVRGPFLYVGDEKFWIRGVTYGAFRPDPDGQEYWNAELIEQDFAQMAANNLNAVRIPHTVPPRSLLDAAQRHGLRVMVGLSAEQYVGYLIDQKRAPDVEAIVRIKAQAVAGHPALLCYALGNEIPAPVLRWLGRRRVERFLEKLYHAVKAEDPEGIVAYVNYPTAEYLRLPFLDAVAFNVYLESPDRLDAYLARLHNLAGHRPLIMSELGLDSLRHGGEMQARVLDWQVRSTFAAGCAGMFIFSWTDEWHRAGAEVEDWKFGLTRGDRTPKPALAAVREVFEDVPFPRDTKWPKISVVVCTYNGSKTIRDCFEGLRRLEYPCFEVIVVNDGSKDGTAAIAREYGHKVISTENRGLSCARNTGLAAATGEIVAYIDDDAWPDVHWLSYLAAAFMKTDFVGVGGPNIPPLDDGAVAECVANAPGGPVHVLISDREAEHIPGCNMAFRREALQAVGGFDPQFRSAGDDVDVCWRLQARGWRIGFHPAALVWHHRRNSIRAYWRQQQGYGKAEALLERKWPAKYNGAGHVSWKGRMYGKGLTQFLRWRRERIYQGIWGTAPFQSETEVRPTILQFLPLMPEWYLVVLGLVALSALSLSWRPLVSTLPILGLAAFLPVMQAYLSARQASFPSQPQSIRDRAKLVGLTAVLHLIQPAARLWGRIRSGLTPWRSRSAWLVIPRARQSAVWTERWVDPVQRLHAVEAALKGDGAVVLHGAEFDAWDLEVRGGLLGFARLLMAVEDHGAGTQFVRVRSWPRYTVAAVLTTALLGVLALAAFFQAALLAATVLGILAGIVGLRMLVESATAQASLLLAVERAARELH
jgi:GT2 family glycosyltransferase